MKKQRWNKLLSILKVVIVFLILLSADVNIFSQPGMPSDHGQNGNQGPGGFAPVGEGLLIFLASAAVYGIRKIRSRKKSKGS